MAALPVLVRDHAENWLLAWDHWMGKPEFHGR
jgi:hypothetical protein